MYSVLKLDGELYFLSYKEKGKNIYVLEEWGCDGAEVRALGGDIHAVTHL